MARFPGRDPVYTAAAAFRERCLTTGYSLLWPDRLAWQPDALQALWNAVMENPDTGERTFLEKLKDQLASQPNEVHEVAAEVLACAQRRPNMLFPHLVLLLRR